MYFEKRGLCPVYEGVTAVFFHLFNFKVIIFQILGHLYQFRALCLNLKCHAQRALLNFESAKSAVTIMFGDAFSNNGGKV